MDFYYYDSLVPLGKEGAGTQGKGMFHDLKTVKGAIRRLRSYGYKEFSLYTYTKFFDDKTFKLVHKERGD